MHSTQFLPHSKHSAPQYEGQQVKVLYKYIPSLLLECCEVYKYIFWVKLTTLQS